MATDRWQAQRGKRVYSRAGRRPAARRRGEKLLVAARRLDREGIGAGDAAVAEVVTPGWFHRSVMREDGAGNTFGWLIFTLLYAACVSLTVGVGLAAAWIVYGLWWLTTPKVGAMRFIPVAALGVGAAVIATASLLFGSHDSASALAFAVWWRVQIVFGLGWLAFLIHANGWPAVEAETKKNSSAKARIKVNREQKSEPQPEPVQEEKTEPRATIKIARKNEN